MEYYERISAEVSQIFVSYETPIQWEQFSLPIHAASGTLYSLFILQYS